MIAGKYSDSNWNFFFNILVIITIRYSNIPILIKIFARCPFKKISQPILWDW